MSVSIYKSKLTSETEKVIYVYCFKDHWPRIFFLWENKKKPLEAKSKMHYFSILYYYPVCPRQQQKILLRFGEV